MTTRADYDAAQIARATHYVVTVFMGRGRYRRRPCVTLDRARLKGQGIADRLGRPVMIYAIVPDILRTSIHVENVYPQKEGPARGGTPGAGPAMESL